VEVTLPVAVKKARSPRKKPVKAMPVNSKGV